MEKKIYGYTIRDNKDDIEKDLYFENSPDELVQNIKEYKSKGYDILDFDEILSDALRNSSNWTRNSEKAQYGYAGKFTSEGDLEVNPEIVKILKERIETLKAKSEFENLKITEDQLLNLIRDDSLRR